MRKVIAAINMTIDGVADHTAGLPDDELHRHYTDLLDAADDILYGSITYQLMQYWQTLIENPSGEETVDGFARAIDRIPKTVFSRQLRHTGWASAQLATETPGEVVSELRQQPGNDILVGSRSLMLQLMKLNLIDEYQFCIHPVIAGKGMLLFEGVHDRTFLSLVRTEQFSNGTVVLYYQPVSK